jgi:hypothetical protein
VSVHNEFQVHTVDADMQRRLTEAVREADRAFEQVGGTSRHYVLECLLPSLAKARLGLVDLINKEKNMLNPNAKESK